MKPAHLRIPCAAATLLFAAIHSADGQIITANVTDLDRPSYWYSATNITSGGSPFAGGSGEILCIDPFEEGPEGTGELRAYAVTSSATIFASATTQASLDKSVDVVNWMFDHYYTSNYTPADANGAEAFQYALWEMSADFNGTAASLNTSSGNVTTPVEYSSVTDGLASDLPGIPTGYRSGQYNILFLDDTAQGYQSMVFVQPIPEPGVSGLALLSIVPLLALRRGRKAI